MQTIDPVLLLQPLLSFVIALVILLYWWRTRGFRGVVLLISAGAYFIAIVAKSVVSVIGAVPVSSTYGTQSIEYALFLGSQTVILEIGLAYLFALYGAKRRGLTTSDAVPMGIGLAFWENGVFLGLLTLFGLGVLYLLLQSSSPLAAQVYQQLQTSAPGLFLPPSSVLPSVLIATLERVSSELAHIAWGILVVLAAVTSKKRYLALALPMGLLDFLVPFASYNLYVFEAGVFLLSLGFLAVAWKSFTKEKVLSRPSV